MKLISIVVPCYNEQEVLPFFYNKITEIMNGMVQKHGIDYELTFADNGSKDKTLEEFRELSQKDNRVRFISFFQEALENPVQNKAITENLGYVLGRA